MLQPLGADGHDRDVDQDQRQHDDVRGGDELAGLAERQLRRQGEQQGHDGAALRPTGRTASSPSRVRRRRRTWERAFLAAISYFHSVRYSRAKPTRDTANVRPIDGSRLAPPRVSTRGCTYAVASWTAT